jgi:citrate synthase
MSGGLEGVVAAETVLSLADGERGIIWVRGRTLESLAPEGFEAAVALIWDRFAGDGLDRAGVAAALGQARVVAFGRLATWLDAARRQPLAEGVRICLAAIPDGASPAEIAAALPVGLAALLRARQREAPVVPDPRLGVAADFLRMATGDPVEDRLAAALDTYLTTVIDNGLSASTFAARIVASTGGSLAAAVTGAWCAFTGPKHGGAPGPALDLFDELAEAEDKDALLDRKLRSGERLIGFGHRVFRVRDPRAEILGAALRRLGADTGRLAVAREIEQRVTAALERFKPGRRLRPNVELNAALLLDAVGMSRDAFTPVFAMARCPGWIAHALEERRTGRMIRPASTYVGPTPA